MDVNNRRHTNNTEEVNKNRNANSRIDNSSRDSNNRIDAVTITPPAMSIFSTGTPKTKRI